MRNSAVTLPLPRPGRFVEYIQARVRAPRLDRQHARHRRHLPVGGADDRVLADPSCSRSQSSRKKRIEARVRALARLDLGQPDAAVLTQPLVSWAEHLVFVFPNWWGAMPALMTDVHGPSTCGPE